MNTIGVLLLAAATAGDGFGYTKPGVGLKKLLRPHVVAHGAPPAGGMISDMGPGGPGGPASGRRFPNVKSQIYFLDPDGMHIGWQAAGTGGDKVYLPAQLTVPARYNFMQGYIYRLKLTDIPGRAGAVLYPSIEVAPSTPATDAYLTHNPIPVQFTAEDFDQVVDGGNFVTKVIYLPDPKYQELAIAGVETLVSTRLEPGVDPIIEADKRGTILLIVRIGAIDLEMQNGATAAAPVVGAPTMPMAPAVDPSATILAPGTLPPGAVPASPVPTITPDAAAAPAVVPVDNAPAAPAAGAPPVPAPTVPPAPAPPTVEDPAPAEPAADPK